MNQRLRNEVRIGVLGLLFFATIVDASRLPAQRQTASGPGFEVATVKPSPNDANGSNFNFSQGRFSTQNVTLLQTMKLAYDLNMGTDEQIEGGPSWVRTVPFDINAKEDNEVAKRLDATAPDQRMVKLRGMLQRLLVERFALKTHTESRERTVDALVQGKGGSKLKRTAELGNGAKTDGDSPPRWSGLHNDGRGHIEGRGATMEMLANVLGTQSDIGGRMVADATGMGGDYDFDLRFTPEQAGAHTDGSAGASLFAALQEQLGLRLESRKVPVKVLVIDSVEKPSVN